MPGLYIKYIFAFLWTLVAFLLIRRILIQKEKQKFASILSIIYCFILVLIIYNLTVEFREYISFNNLQNNQITAIKLNKKLVDKNNFGKLSEELKRDRFTWSNHPNVIQKDTIIIFTKERKYLFLIERTSNQGILVSRINQKGNDYVTNRNDYLLQYLE